MPNSSLLSQLDTWKQLGEKKLAVLLDPDKYTPERLVRFLLETAKNPPDLFLVGGSLLLSERLEQTVAYLKAHTAQPVVLFPGSNLHLSPQADALLFLSLISGRNPEFLIGQHVVAAPMVAHMQLEAIPTGYLLIESGNATTVAYMSNTTPIPREKTDVAVATAMAGQLLGLRVLYLDGGSGAKWHVPETMLAAVRRHTHLPLWVGGGIRTGAQAAALYRAGADMLVVGNHLEENPDFLHELFEARRQTL